MELEFPIDAPIDKEIDFGNLSVLLASGQWRSNAEVDFDVTSYFVCQRLSADRPELRIGNLQACDVFPRQHSVGLVPPGQSIRLYPEKQPFRALNCMFDTDYFSEMTGIDSGRWLTCPEATVTVDSPRVESLMQAIYREIVHPDFGQRHFIEAASMMIAVELGRMSRTLGRWIDDVESQRLAPWQLRRINDRIGASLEAGYPSLRELAKLCGISVSHLTRVFKASTGTSLSGRIASERLRQARRLLQDDSKSIKMIAGLLGFCSPAHFAAAFRRSTGESPRDFRKRALAGDMPLTSGRRTH